MEVLKENMMNGISDHVFTLDLLDDEKEYCQNELLRLYNQGTITENDIAVRLSELKRIVKSTYDNICDFHNLVEGIRR
jgi:hypothetical protein